MSPQPYQEELTQWLAEHGHAPEEIDKIMARLAAYDQAMVRDAFFGAMHSGSFNLDALMHEVTQKVNKPYGSDPPPGRGR